MIHECLYLLGRRATDRVTGFTGVISSVTFDLYGCVQAIVTPPVNAEGKVGDANWFDVKRLTTGDRVMEPPSFATLKFGTEIGCAERPRGMRQP
jgi:hypothetical protein